jgi:hypothetical protein
VPSFGRLSDSLIEQHAFTLQIGEFRLLSGELVFNHWLSHEPSIAIELRSIEISKKRCWLHSETYAVIGLHALARRYERCPQRDFTVIMADRKAIISSHVTSLQQREFMVRCADGCWRGEVVRAHFQHREAPRRALAIGTYVADIRMPNEHKF